MAGVNKVILIGYCGGDPETRYLPNGDPVSNVSLATSETWKDKEGNKQERTEWHRLQFFGRLAEIVGQYVKKGSPIYIEGSIRSNKYTDKEGVEKVSYQITCSSMKLLGSKSDGERPAQQERQQPAKQKPAADDFDDDIPFN
jgi:single-strand DNA-binding protein